MNVTIAPFDLTFGQESPFVFIGGPCVIEDRDHALFAAERIGKACAGAGVPFVYKSSFDKANRSSASSFRGVGIDEGLMILEKVKGELGVPVLSDIHSPEEAKTAASVLDILQIPAFLCRQTDLLMAAGATGRVVNVKKGQFMAPWDMGNAVEKVRAGGGDRILLTERGNSFGYNTLVVDMQGLPQMARFAPVIFDAGHSVQKPGGLG
ncbi:MAG: 3-deoxy-8-phosphooctulonate synthase, partial [Nitrospinae bacterium]|nr:3-deoxy-8-phosphooctulonate synthase [Nitrospinota bacterium]